MFVRQLAALLAVFAIGCLPPLPFVPDLSRASQVTIGWRPLGPGDYQRIVLEKPDEVKRLLATLVVSHVTPGMLAIRGGASTDVDVELPEGKSLHMRFFRRDIVGANHDSTWDLKDERFYQAVVALIKEKRRIDWDPLKNQK